MGMSASQARFLCLTARKNNVEFEGQQINQQRTCLSNESATYYSELCNMAVPVPPSIDDYTKITYTFDDGAMKNTVTSLLYSSTDNSYHVSYLQEWQDDYSVTPASSSLVLKSGSDYSVGGVKLRQLGQLDANDPYLKTLGESERNEVMQTEAYYQELLRDYTDNTNEVFYVRYVKNEDSGAYEPIFYSQSELNNTPYNDRNLASVATYSIGPEVKTREVLNVQCDVEQDSSGRYIALIFGREEGTRQVEKTIQDGWIPGPLLNEGEMIDNPEYLNWLNSEPPQKIVKETIPAWTERVHTSQLYETAMNTGCISIALDGRNCYMHVLSDMLGPGVHTTSSGVSYTIYNGDCQDSDHSSQTWCWNTSRHSVDESLRNALKEKKCCGDNSHNETVDINRNGHIYSDVRTLAFECNQNLTIYQKLVDLLWAVHGDYEIGHSTGGTANPDHLAYFWHFIEFDLDEATVIEHPEEIIGEDNPDYITWLESKPAEKIAADPVYGPDEPIMVTVTVDEHYYEAGNRIPLVANTITDEAAYNDAMNDYFYQQNAYEHKIQEINSKLEIIQHQDKQLELKLKQLDTEENAISTEMDAVKKVISKNVDSSFKTFSA